ncbi:solute carrier family 23 protein, partial [Klebsiella pneumoniae]|nr:solute carrier family 23 protein [Klebsiella pneumoniae]
TMIASTLGMVSLEPVAQASWFHLPQPFYFGAPSFEISSCITMIFIAVVSMVESTGVFLAIGNIINKDITKQDLTKGYRAEGLAQ